MVEKNINDLISLPFLLHALAGTLANILSISLVFPFDTARTRQQIQDKRLDFSVSVVRDIARSEGWTGLYRGWRSLTLSLSVTNFIYFSVFHGFKLSADIQTVENDLLFATFAGCSAVVVSNPLWVVNTKLKLQGVKIESDDDDDEGGRKEKDFYNGIMDCFLQVYAREGVRAYYAGVVSSLFLVLNPAINLMTYEYLKRLLLHEMPTFWSTSVLYFIFGGIAKFFATVVTYPLQVIQTRSRAGLPILSRDMKQNSIFSQFLFLYRGLESKLTQTVLTSAIMFLTYEHFRTVLFYCARTLS